MFDTFSDFSRFRMMRYSVLGALALAGLVALWFVFGGSNAEKSTVADGGSADQERTSVFRGDDKSVFTVLGRRFALQDSSFQLRLGGRSKAVRSSQVLAQTTGTVEEILFQLGDFVKKDQPLARFSKENRELQVQEAQVKLEKAQAAYEASQRVEERGYQSRLSLLDSRSQLREAEQKLRAAEEALKDTILVSPFSGTIVKSHIELGSAVSPGSRTIDIIDSHPIEIVFFVSELRHQLLRKGIQVRFLMANGVERSGKVVYISPAADLNTSTYEVRVSADNSDQAIPVGMTSDVYLTIPGAKGYQVPYSAITLSESGRIIIRTVDENNLVHDHAVKILREAEGGTVWITGIPPDSLVITAGQDFVLEGQKVQLELQKEDDTLS